jgi:phosphoribulokinase
LKQQIQQRTTQPTSLTDTDIATKWATFTYASPRIRKTTNLFKHTNIKIAFKSNNTISQLMKPDSKNNTPTYNKSCIYQLNCNTCKLAYVGQTSRNLKLLSQEYMRYIRNNKPQSAYAQHILQNQHEYGTMDNIMTLLKPLKNNTMLIPCEQFFIQSLHQEGKLIAGQHPGEPNLLFQLAIDHPHTTHDETSRSISLTSNT